ncbi:hypothetical protein GCM10017612_41520 [Novosphingobium resinovorum]|jgi:hypothetical protein|nr:hypothetical protein GCM10017612_41520 [Novosphingobium resinovorum]
MPTIMRWLELRCGPFAANRLCDMSSWTALGNADPFGGMSLVVAGRTFFMLSGSRAARMKWEAPIAGEQKGTDFRLPLDSHRNFRFKPRGRSGGAV